MFSRWVTGFHQEVAAGTCFGGTMWDGCSHFPKEGGGVLVEQLASLQLSVSGCVSTFLGLSPSGVGALGPTACGLLGGIWLEKVQVQASPVAFRKNLLHFRQRCNFQYVD